MTERWILKNGLVVLYRRDADMPLAAGTLLLRSGSRNETLAEAGLCNYVFEMLLSGTRRKNARQIADVIESMGGSFGAQAAEDYSEIDWLAPAVHAERVLRLMAEILTEPAWPAAEQTKQRRHILLDLKTRSDVIFNVAYDAFRKHIYRSHPYGRPIDGTLETVNAFTRQDLVRWHHKYFRPDQAIFALAGPWTNAEAKKMMKKIMASWKKPPHAGTLQAPSAIAPLVPTALPVVIKAVFQQAYFMSGTFAPPMGAKEILPLKLWNMILGGGMSSRLFVKLREERGLAYEISSFYPARLDGSSWAVYMGLPAERLPEAEYALGLLLQDLADKGPTAAELKQAKQLLEGTYVMDHQTRRRQAWYAAWWEFLGRPPHYDRSYLERIKAVTLKQVRDASEHLLAQPRLTIKVVPR